LQSVEWGWRGRIPSILGIYRPTRGEETSSPQEACAKHTQRHLGASSPSGNARGGCRGCTPASITLQPSDKNGIMPESMYFEFGFYEFPLPPKRKRSKWKIPPQTPPFPFATPNSKNN